MDTEDLKYEFYKKVMQRIGMDRFVKDYHKYAEIEDIVIEACKASYDAALGKNYSGGYEDGYSDGFDEGYNADHDNIYNESYIIGYTAGYDEGHVDGYKEGYDQGYDDAICC